MDLTRRIVGYLPRNNIDPPPVGTAWQAPEVSGTELDALVPDSAQRSYDMHRVIAGIVDAGSFTEVHALFARNIICGFARVEGRSVGIVAQQPEVLAEPSRQLVDRHAAYQHRSQLQGQRNALELLADLGHGRGVAFREH